MSMTSFDLVPLPKTVVPVICLDSWRMLVIEDDLQLLPLIARAAQGIDPDLVIDWAVDRDEARSAMLESQYDAVLADYLLPGSPSGFTVHRDCRRLQPHSRFAMMSSMDIPIPVGCHGFLKKPFGIVGCREFLYDLLPGVR